MVSNPVLECWHDLQLRHPEWALRAYSRLVMTLSQDVQQRLQLRDAVAEPYVVVFGKTQVGKTTLLLDLMGVAPSQLARVSRVLRGGRPVGQSATATTMEYCRSTNECWGFSRNGVLHWLERDEDMSQALGELREEMELGHLKADTVPCVVHIPKSCFLDSTRGLAVRMLDLPGDKPANQEEQRHVHLMAKTYLPFADLILLVGKGDDLGFLRPGEITLPGIEDWQAMPYRFRIVTTYSYNAKSVKDILRKEPNIDAAQVRHRLIEQVERFGILSEPARDARLYFPLEFGSSWLQTEKDEPLLHSRMAPIINHLRDELLEQITSSTTPMGRLRSTLDTHISVSYIQTQKTRAIDVMLQALEQRKDALTAEAESWASLVHRSREKLQDASALLARHPSEHAKSSISQAAVALQNDSTKSLIPAEGNVEDDRQTLYTLIRNYYRVLGSMRLDVLSGSCPISYWRQVRNSLRLLTEAEIQSTLDNKFGSVWHKLNDYWFDTYFSSSNYQTDRNLVHAAGKAARLGLVALWEQQWLQALDVTECAFGQEFKQLEAETALHEEQSQQASARVEAVELDIIELDLKRINIAQDSKEDLERCERFITLLEEEYSVTLDQQYAAALAQSDPADALLGLFSCVALSQQYYEFMALSQQRFV